MEYPVAWKTDRPTELQVRQNQCWESLKLHIQEIGLQMAVCEELDQLDAVFQGESEHVCGKAKPGLLDIPAVTPPQVRTFYEAPAFFFRHNPGPAGRLHAPSQPDVSPRR